MAEIVVVATTSAGASVAVDLVSSQAYQIVKLADGSVDSSIPIVATSAQPATGTFGLVVALKDGASVTVQQGISVSAQVSGTVSVGTVSTLLGTVSVNVVAGGGSVTTAAPSISATGQVIWVAGGQSTTAFPVVITGTVTAGAGTTVISGTVTVNNGLSVSAQVSGTVTVAGSVAISGTGLVSVVPGVSVNVGSQATGVYTTTATSGVTGPIVWLGVEQTIATIKTISTILGTQIVSVVPGLSVSAVVSGTVTVAGSVAISGTGLVSIVPGVSVNIGSQATGVYTTTATSGVTGALVWLGVGQTIATVSTISTILGTQVITLATGATIATVLGTIPVTGTIQNVASISTILGTNVVTLATGGTIATLLGTLPVTGTIQNVASISTILGTAVVSVVPGLSVSAVVSGTVTVNGTVAVSGYSVTTAGPSISATGMMVWIVGGQGTTATPVVVTGTVAAGAGTTVVSGTLTVQGTVTAIPADRTTATPSAAGTGAIVWVANPGAAVATTVLTVSIVNVVPVVTQASVSVTGLPVWWNATAALSVNPGVSVSAVVSGTVTVIAPAVSTIVTILGTQIVSVVPGLSVSAVVSGTVTVIAPAVSTIVTILGTQIVSVVPGLSVSAVVSGTVTVGTGTVNVATGTVVALDVGRTNVMITVASSSVGISGTTMPFGLYVGLSVPVSGTTSWVVPAGKTFRVLSVNIIAQNSVTTAPALVQLMVLASTALPTWTSTVPVVAKVMVQPVSATISYSACAVQIADIPAGVTVGMAFTIGTSGASIAHAVVAGYLFP